MSEPNRGGRHLPDCGRRSKKLTAEARVLTEFRRVHPSAGDRHGTCHDGSTDCFGCVITPVQFR